MIGDYIMVVALALWEMITLVRVMLTEEAVVEGVNVNYPFFVACVVQWALVIHV